MAARRATYRYAVQPSWQDEDDQVVWLKPREVEKFRARTTRARVSGLLRMAAATSFGVMLNFSSVETAFAPSAAQAAVDLSGFDRLALATILPVEAAPIPVTPFDIDLPPSPKAIGLRTETHGATEPADADLAKALSDMEHQLEQDLNLKPGQSATGGDPDEIMGFGAMQIPRWLVETILRAARVTGVDPVYMMALADKESSFSPEVRARTSSAEGLFQFVARTWLNVVREHGSKYGLEAEAAAIAMVDGEPTITDEEVRERILGLRRDPYLSALMAAELLKGDRARIERRIGRDLTRSEFYLAHFLGAESASRFMEILSGKPKQNARRVFPQAARANKALFFTRKGRKLRALSVAEVYDRIDRMIDKRLDRYVGVTEVATSMADMADPSLRGPF